LSILAGAGFCALTQPWGIHLGWLAAELAVMTACIRMQGAALTGTAGLDFRCVWQVRSPGAKMVSLLNCPPQLCGYLLPMATMVKKAGGKVVRVNPRFPEKTAMRLKEASAIRGQSVAAFVLEVVSREAERVLEEEKYWSLGVEAAGNIQRMLAKPPAMNAAAKKAAKDLAEHVRIRS
jgi:uncharacterized protein (DUF1778 family)